MPYDKSTARIVQRLHEHETKTMPVIDRYRQYHGVTTINGEGTFDDVLERLAFEVENGLKSLR
jgi:adenylate kinase